MCPSRLLLLAMLVCPAAAGSGCTWIVVDDMLHNQAPCEGLGDCAAGFRCAAADGAAGKTCVAVADDSPVPAPGQRIDDAGGVVEGPDNVSLVFDAGSVGGTLQVEIQVASATNVPVGVIEKSRFFEVSPSAKLTTAATLRIPAVGCAACRVFQRPADPGTPWTLLDEGAALADHATGVVDDPAGVYVAGEVAP